MTVTVVIEFAHADDHSAAFRNKGTAVQSLIYIAANRVLLSAIVHKNTCHKKSVIP